MNSSRQRILISVLALEAAIRVAFIAYTGPMTDQGFYGDDSFMSHQMAATVACGGGITQAGRVTNGFQPLFVFLLVPVFWAFNHAQATVVSALITSAFSVTGSYLLFRLLRSLFNNRIGLMGLVLWAISPYLTRIGLNGLETSLANMLMLALLCIHVASVRPSARFAVPYALLVGVVMGLAVLARLDLALLIAAIAFDQVRVRLRHRQYRQLAVLFFSCGVVVAPWFMWSLVKCGSIIPVSGAATRTISLLYGAPTGPAQKPAYFPLDHVPFSYYASNVAQACRQLIIQAPLVVPITVLAGKRAGVAVGWLIVVLVAAGNWRSKNREENGPWQMAVGLMRTLWFAWLFLLLIVGAYCLHFFGQWHFWRYLSPCVILLIIPSALLIDRIWQNLTRGASGFWAMVLLGTAAVGISAVGHLSLLKSPDPTGIARRLYQDTMYLRDHVDPAARIGSFESGTLDYFLDRDVFNLDGKTNALALHALIAGRMDLLVEELDLDFVVSSPFLIRDLLDRRGRWQPGQLTLVQRLAHVDIISVAQASEGPGN